MKFLILSQQYLLLLISLFECHWVHLAKNHIQLKLQFDSHSLYSYTRAYQSIFDHWVEKPVPLIIFG
jgi:hypothetical protein